jgi:integrase
MEPEYFLKPEEFHQLLKTTETSRDRLILLLLGGAGLRVGEMTQVRVEDFDLDAGCLHIRSEVARGGKGNGHSTRASHRRACALPADIAIDRVTSFLKDVGTHQQQKSSNCPECPCREGEPSDHQVRG